jgi:hypothetical protein
VPGLGCDGADPPRAGRGRARAPPREPLTHVEPAVRALLTRVYAAFNARDLETVLATLHPDVDWANGMDGGRVHGVSNVRDYWTQQFTLIDPRVDPVGFAIDAAGRIVVRVHQMVCTPAGAVISDGMVEHIYVIDDGLITRMDIRKGEAS